MRRLKLPIVKESKVLFDRFVKIRCDTLEYGNGTAHDYFTLIPKADAINVLATTPEGHYVLMEEYRHPTGKVLLCCPGGYLEPDESPEEGARRELLEETGYAAQDFKVIGSAYPYPGLSSQNIIYVKATEAVKVSEPHLEASEVLRTVIMSEKDLKAAIARGVALDGILCTALFLSGKWKVES